MVGWLCLFSNRLCVFCQRTPFVPFNVVADHSCNLLTLRIIFATLFHSHLNQYLLKNGKRRPIYSTYEKYEGDLNQARHQKTNKDYLTALALVNDILKKAPKLPEALYLKAQILWEGYHKGEDAKANLETILVLLPDKSETYHAWAQTLIDEINSA